jgi:hypothetical protein
VNRYRLVAAAFALLALYYFTIPANHTETEDAFDFAYRVRTASFAELIYPHHLVYLPAAKLLYSTGLFRDAFKMMLGIDLLLGVAAVVLVYFLARLRLDLSARAALFAAAFLAFSYGYWRYSVAAEVYIPAIFMQALLCYAVFAKENTRARDFLCGGLGALAIATHGPVSAPLAVAAIPVYLALSRRFRSLFIYGAVATTAVIAAYYFGHRLHAPDEGTLRNFIAFVKGPPEEIRAFSAATLAKAALGFGASFVSSNVVFALAPVAARLQALMPYRNLTEELFMAKAFSPWVAGLSVICGSALGLLGIYILTQLRVRLGDLQRFVREPKAVALLVWIVVYIVLVTIINPDSPELWICLLLPLALTTGLLLDRFFKDKILRLPLVFCALLFVQNLCGMAMIHSPASDYNAHKATWLLSQARSGDAIFTRDADVFTRYLRYHVGAGVAVTNCWANDAAATEQLVNAARENAARIFLFTDVFEPPLYLRSKHGDIVEGLAALQATMREKLQPTADPSVWLLEP